MNSIPLYKHTKICISILVLMNIWAISSLAIMHINTATIILLYVS